MANWIFPVIGANEWSRGSWMPNSQTHRGRTHAAVDIYAATNSSIVAPVSGTIKNFGTGNIGGNWVQVQGDDGNVYYFAHMNQHATGLKKGQKIGVGQNIGFVGNTGSAKNTKPHVHFSVKRNGKAISPIPLLEKGLVMPAVPEYNYGGMEGQAGYGGQDYADYINSQVGSGVNAEPGTFDQAPPAWLDQLKQYRESMGTEQNPQAPIRDRARTRLHRTLSSMSDMVRSQGFDTGAGMPDTGIVGADDETGLTAVSREETSRA